MLHLTEINHPSFYHSYMVGVLEVYKLKKYYFITFWFNFTNYISVLLTITLYRGITLRPPNYRWFSFFIEAMIYIGNFSWVREWARVIPEISEFLFVSLISSHNSTWFFFIWLYCQFVCWQKFNYLVW